MSDKIGPNLEHGMFCGFSPDLSTDTCGAAASSHWLTTDTAAVGLDGEFILDYESDESYVLFACPEHEPKIPGMFEWCVSHPAVHPCGHRSAVFLDDRCEVATEDDPAVSVAAMLTPRVGVR